eukprot:7431592-Pyramimonas_sp.AAC.1
MAKVETLQGDVHVHRDHVGCVPGGLIGLWPVGSGVWMAPRWERYLGGIRFTSGIHTFEKKKYKTKHRMARWRCTDGALTHLPVRPVRRIRAVIRKGGVFR